MALHAIVFESSAWLIRRRAVVRTIGIAALALLLSDRADAQPATSSDAPAAAPQASGQTADFDNPWSRRPVCESMFLKADWQLSAKQRACDWIQNGVLSTTALLGAVGSAWFSKITDRPSERGDGFALRFGRNFAQNAIKSTGAYVGGAIAHEDPRTSPPYLALNTAPPPRGFFNRTAHALARNVVATQCVKGCREESDIHRRFKLSAVLGSASSGVAGDVLTSSRPDVHDQALHGALSAYAATFANALVDEFKPELSAFGGRVFRLLGGR